MSRRDGTPPELGARVAGQVLDADAWEHQSRIRLALPYRRAVGTVHVVYPYAPRVVGVALDSGERVHVHLAPQACTDCGHDAHTPGDCLAAMVSAAGYEGSLCCCGAPGPAPVLPDGDELAAALDAAQRAQERAQ